jgi:hypothetical protein
MVSPLPKSLSKAIWAISLSWFSGRPLKRGVSEMISNLFFIKNSFFPKLSFRFDLSQGAVLAFEIDNEPTAKYNA